VVSLPHWSNVRPETKHICEQFRNHHLENCKKDIAKDRRWASTVLQLFFSLATIGNHLENGLVEFLFLNTLYFQNHF